MAESFYLFNSDFEYTDTTESTIYIVLTDPTKAIGEDELSNYWFDNESPTDEIESIKGYWKYYTWKEAYKKYLPLTDNVIIERLNKVMNSSCSELNESESSEVNTTDSTSKKYKLYITLENGTVIEPNYTSADPADFAGEIELMSSERYFAGKIKSIKIE